MAGGHALYEYGGDRGGNYVFQIVVPAIDQLNEHDEQNA